LATYLLEASHRTDIVRVQAGTVLPPHHEEILAMLGEEATEVADAGVIDEGVALAADSHDIPRLPAVDALLLPTLIRRSFQPDVADSLTDLLARRVDVMVGAILGGADSLLDTLHTAATEAAGPQALLLDLQAMRLASLRTDRQARLNPLRVMAMSGRSLLALGDGACWHRVTAQLCVERGVAAALGMLGWSPADILDLRVEDLDDASEGLPPAGRPAFGALAACRRDVDEADPAEPALSTRGDRLTIDERTVRRWISVGLEEAGFPTPALRSATGRTTAVERLKRYGIEWSDAN
jgi:hypothetical protein